MQSRYEKLQQHIAVTCELRIQKMIQEKNRLDDELKQWQLEETTKSTQAREKCIEMLSTVFKGNNQSDNQIIIKVTYFICTRSTRTLVSANIRMRFYFTEGIY